VLNKEVGREKRTLAMRLGLEKGKITIWNISYYLFSDSEVKHLPVEKDFFHKEKDR
jgi:hypothetical protein